MRFPFSPLKLPNKGKKEYSKMILFISFHSLLPSEALVFGRMEKWRNEKLLCLVEKKNEKMENEVGINLQYVPIKENKKVTHLKKKKIVYGHF